jgi:hypothetical protein
MSEIKPGDVIRVKENVKEELDRLEFEETDTEEIVKNCQGKTFKVLDVWFDEDTNFRGIVLEGSNEWFVTIDLCVEIPINACEKV